MQAAIKASHTSYRACLCIRLFRPSRSLSSGQCRASQTCSNEPSRLLTSSSHRPRCTINSKSPNTCQANRLANQCTTLHQLLPRSNQRPPAFHQAGSHPNSDGQTGLKDIDQNARRNRRPRTRSQSQQVAIPAKEFSWSLCPLLLAPGFSAGPALGAPAPRREIKPADCPATEESARAPLSAILNIGSVLPGGHHGSL